MNARIRINLHGGVTPRAVLTVDGKPLTVRRHPAYRPFNKLKVAKDEWNPKTQTFTEAGVARFGKPKARKLETGVQIHCERAMELAREIGDQITTDQLTDIIEDHRVPSGEQRSKDYWVKHFDQVTAAIGSDLIAPWRIDGDRSKWMEFMVSLKNATGYRATDTEKLAVFRNLNRLF